MKVDNVPPDVHHRTLPNLPPKLYLCWEKINDRRPQYHLYYGVDASLIASGGCLTDRDISTSDASWNLDSCPFSSCLADLWHIYLYVPK